MLYPDHPLEITDFKGECATNGLDPLPYSPEREEFCVADVGSYKTEDPFEDFALAEHAPIFVVTVASPEPEVAPCPDPDTATAAVNTSGEELLHEKTVGTISVEARRLKIQRYLAKRSRRNFRKKIAYQCRKTVADSRMRVKGRFVTKREEQALRTGDYNNLL